jgi:hypothetical protein
MSLWTERDEPVLRWLSENPPHGNFLSTNWMHDGPDERLPQLTQAGFHRAVETLHDAGYVSSDGGMYESGGGVHFALFQVTGSGKQALGLWPRFDALGEPSELAAILDALAENAPTEEEEGVKSQARGERCSKDGARRNTRLGSHWTERRRARFARYLSRA